MRLKYVRESYFNTIVLDFTVNLLSPEVHYLSYVAQVLPFKGGNFVIHNEALIAKPTFIPSSCATWVDYCAPLTIELCGLAGETVKTNREGIRIPCVTIDA